MNERELEALVSILKPIVYGDQTSLAYLQQQGVNVTRADFYSEIPTLSDIQNAKKGPSLHRIFPENAVMLDFLQKLNMYSIEFDPPKYTDDEAEYSWGNPLFSHSDAMSYYCMIRLIKPKQILEIGGGFSTLVAKMALERNGFGNLRVIEPYPRDFLKKLAGIDLVELAFQDLDSELLSASIGEGDIVFIDSTHSLKYGSEVLNIYLDFLHLISAQCHIHVHDIYLPEPLPLNYMLRHQVFWGEQYLLYAYLLNNPRSQILFGSNFHLRNNPLELSIFMGEKHSPGGGSFWFSQGPP